MAQPYLITGVHVQPNDVFPRYEIRDLQRDHPEQFTLFILGWTKIRQPDYQPLAAQHVQQAGIHGLPYERWPGDPAASVKPVGTWGGYCNHGSVLFPTWHRPVVLLLEQSIGEAALGIAQEFAKQYPEEEATWLQAARELRFPFWDWTLPVTGTEGLPKIFHPDQNLTLKGPGGQTIQSENILAFYRFGPTRPAGFVKQVVEENPLTPAVYAYFDEWDRTYRWPNTATGTTVNPKEDYEQIDKFLRGEIPNIYGASYKEILNNVAHLFLFPDKTGSSAPAPDQYPVIWDEFSNTAHQSSNPKHHEPAWPTYHASSVESSHNLMHLIIGGSGGHMMDNDYAGFDPIFYLHHCNVDRLYALWEYVYPDYWMGENGYNDPDGKHQDFTQDDGTFTETGKQALTQNTDVTPFRKTAEAYWTSSDARSLEVRPGVVPKHYTYPEVAGVRVDRPATDAERSIYLARLQRYFGFDPVKTRNRLPRFRQGLFTSDARNALPPGQEAVADFRRFVIDVELVEHAFHGSYLLVITAKAGQEDLRVGAVAVLGRSGGRTQCAACAGRREANSRIHGVIPIPSDVIVKIIEAKGLNHERVQDHEVISALKGSFQARLVRPGGTVFAESTQDGAPIGGEALPQESVPKLTLHSGNVSAPEEPNRPHPPGRQADVLPEGPFEHYDWQDHDSLLAEGWKFVNAA